MSHPALHTPGTPIERPWPEPARPWSVTMAWEDLLFLHWRVDARALAAHIPPGLELETFDGSAWLDSSQASTLIGLRRMDHLQFLLEEAVRSGRGGGVNVLVAQPRRVAALGLASRPCFSRIVITSNLLI